MYQNTRGKRQTTRRTSLDANDYRPEDRGGGKKEAIPRDNRQKANGNRVEAEVRWTRLRS